jgi:hypothetical protein
MAYKDKKRQALVCYFYQKALGILKNRHIKEFKKIFSDLMKGGKRDGKNKSN